MYYNALIKRLNYDSINQIVTLEISRKDLEKIIDSVTLMVNKQQRALLENLPSVDEGRKNLDDYKALAEDLRKIS